MAGPAAAVRGLAADVERVASAFDETRRDLARVREEAEANRDRAERAEKALTILRKERKAIRDALRSVRGRSEPAG